MRQLLRHIEMYLSCCKLVPQSVGSDVNSARPARPAPQVPNIRFNSAWR